MKILAPALVAVLSLSTVAQQVGDINRNYTVNGIGANAASFVASNLSSPGPVNQIYNTSDAFAPAVWVVSGSGFLGAFTTSTNSVDINFLDPNFAILVVGGGPSLLEQLFFTNGAGDLSLSLAAAGLAGQTWFSSFAHFSPTSADGFYVSQTHAMSFFQDGNLTPGTGAACNPAGAPVALTDDSFLVRSLGFTYTFYGVPYTTCFVGSNGYITFNVGSNILGESVAGHLSGPPSIRMFWDDLNPAAGGAVTFFSDNLGQAEVCFANVPQFATADSNSMVCRFDAAQVYMEYGAMTAVDGLVGLSPGSNLDPVGTALNLSLGSNGITPGAAPYELFTTTSPNDVASFSVTWVMDGLGQPIIQF